MIDDKVTWKDFWDEKNSKKEEKKDANEHIYCDNVEVIIGWCYPQLYTYKKNLTLDEKKRKLSKVKRKVSDLRKTQ